MALPQWILAHGESVQVIVFFALLLLLAAVEPLAPRRPGPMHRSARWPTNAFFTVLNLAALGVLPVSIVGAAFFLLLREGLSRFFTEYYLIPVGLMFIAMVIFMPQGLLGFARRWLNR